MNESITVFSTQWCGYCIRLRAQLLSAGIAFREVDIEADPVAAGEVGRINGGAMIVPTVAFADGSALTNPSVLQIRQHLTAESRLSTGA